MTWCARHRSGFRLRSSLSSATAVFVVTCLVGQALAAPLAQDIAVMRDRLRSGLAKQEKALVATGEASWKGHYDLSERLLSRARTLEAGRQRVLEAIFAEAKVPMPKMQGANPSLGHGRGIFGDVDFSDLSEASYRKVLHTANRLGYDVDLRAGSASIARLDATFFVKKKGKHMRSVAYYADVETMASHGEDLTRKTGRKQTRLLQIWDNLKKMHGALERPHAELRDPGRMQNMVKASLRLRAATGEKIPAVGDVRRKVEALLGAETGKGKVEALLGAETGKGRRTGASHLLTDLEKFVLVKHGYSLRAAGLVSPRASAAQEAKVVASLQKRCRVAARRAHTRALELVGRVEGRFRQAIERARAKDGADRVRRLTKGLHRFRARNSRAILGVMRNGGTVTMAELQGLRIKKLQGDGGEVLYKNLDTGETLTTRRLARRVATLHQRPRPSRTIAEAPALPKSPARSSTLRSALSGRGFLVDAGVAAVMSLTSRLRAGGSLAEGWRDTLTLLASPEFLIGDLGGGVLGAVLGASIPLPGGLSQLGFLGRGLRFLPGIGLAMLGARAGYETISLLRAGEFSFSALVGRLGLAELFAQSLGAAFGMAAVTLFLPGTLGGLVGGLAGGALATWLWRRLRGDEELGEAGREGPMPAGIRLPDASSHTLSQGEASSSRIADLRVSRDEAYRAYLLAQGASDYELSAHHYGRYRSMERALAAYRQQGAKLD